jgi:alkanesulfonate monooxygenase SsuD/methylene tetrahydromethanopterin reductase-like flavin-dependent oxidoreductase (luciferase family)
MNLMSVTAIMLPLDVSQCHHGTVAAGSAARGAKEVQDHLAVHVGRLDGHGIRGRGERFERDLRVYRDVWSGHPVGGNPAVPRRTREVPLLFGAGAPAAYERMARWGQGYIAPSVPPDRAADAFDQARDAWHRAGRDGSPRLVAIAYFAFGDVEAGRGNIRDYYRNFGDEVANAIAAGARGGAAAVKEAVAAFGDLGADELIFNPGLDDLSEVRRLAETVL